MIDKDAIRELIKASFSGDRSAAGRYAAEQRWKGHVKGQGNPPISPRANDITGDLRLYFGNYNGFVEFGSEGDQEIKKRTKEYKLAGLDEGDVQLEIIAEKQGFTGKPKVVSAEEMEQLEKDGWKIVYRGVKDVVVGFGNKTAKSEDFAKQFSEGDYWAGRGYNANGTYFTDDLRTARHYAYITNAFKGTIIKAAIPPKTITDKDEFKEIVQARYSDRKREFGGDDDFGRLLAAKGHRAAQSDDGIFIVWDRSMLAVQEGFVEYK